MHKVIEIQNLKKNFGRVEALKDVSFDVNAGEVVGFIGPNGAGKSTTIRVLLGLIKKSAGSVKVFGLDAWADSYEIHKRVSYVPGEVALWGNLSGGEIIDVFMTLHGSGDQKKRDYLVERFELNPRKKAKTYSKGNRQKVALIAALSVEADLYIFDEPTAGLDPLMEQIFQEEVEKIKGKGKSIILSSHILSEVEKLADQIVIIRQGQIVESGSLEELRHLTRQTITLEVEGDLAQIEGLAGVHDFVRRDNTAVFSVDQIHLNNILLEASKLGIKRFESTPPTLEDLFMRHYKEQI